MSSSVREFIAEQERILEAIGQIRTMEHGTLSQQVYPERAKRNAGSGAVGPYGLWQGTVKGKRFGKRVSGNEAEQLKAGIARRHTFRALCEKYEELCCRLAALERQGADVGEALKKGLKSQSNKAKKLRGS
jgi:hypothetical protein